MLLWVFSKLYKSVINNSVSSKDVYVLLINIPEPLEEKPNDERLLKNKELMEK